MGHETQIYEKFGSSQAISEIDEKMKAIYDLRSGGKSMILNNVIFGHLYRYDHKKMDLLIFTF